MTDFQNGLKLSIKTWSRDSHGLFDYEASSTKNNTLNINNDCKLIRKKNDVRSANEDYGIEFEERELAKISFNDDKVIISNPLNFMMPPTEININDLQNKIWYVIKHEENSSNTINSGMYQIKLNDIIKLGRVKYAITELKIDDKLQTLDKDVNRPVFKLISDYRKIEDTAALDIICKICYHNLDDINNPMINLCKCTGSISAIHFTCLKKWMNTKLSLKENEKKTVMSYSIKAFNCEICMTPYPLRFKSEEKEYDLIDLVRPKEKNYIILESLNQLKEKNNYKSIQIITLKEDERILMGRGHDTDVRINDISVSRSHAHILLLNKKVYIKDLRSKFGTLVLALTDVEIKNKQINLQIGRSYIEFSFSQDIFEKNKKENIPNKFSLNSNKSESSSEDKQIERNRIMLKSEEKIEKVSSNKSILKSNSYELEAEKIQINANPQLQENFLNQTNNSTNNFNSPQLIFQQESSNIHQYNINALNPSPNENIKNGENLINNNNSEPIASSNNIFPLDKNKLISNINPNSKNINNYNNILNYSGTNHSIIMNNKYNRPLNLLEDNILNNTILQNPFIESKQMNNDFLNFKMINFNNINNTTPVNDDLTPNATFLNQIGQNYRNLNNINYVNNLYQIDCEKNFKLLNQQDYVSKSNPNNINNQFINSSVLQNNIFNSGNNNVVNPQKINISSIIENTQKSILNSALLDLNNYERHFNLMNTLNKYQNTNTMGTMNNPNTSIFSTPFMDINSNYASRSQNFFNVNGQQINNPNNINFINLFSNNNLFIGNILNNTQNIINLNESTMKTEYKEHEKNNIN